MRFSAFTNQSYYSEQTKLIEDIKRHLNISLDNVPSLVQEDVILQTLINLKNSFCQHPDYGNSYKLQKEVSIIEHFIERLN